MTLMSEITRVSNNIAAAYTALDGKGATLPAAGSQNSANLADTIDTISTGGGGGEDFDVAAFNSAVSAMNSVMAYTSSSDGGQKDRMKNAGFTYNYGGNGTASSYYGFVLQLCEGAQNFTIQLRTKSESVFFKVADDVNVITSDGAGKTNVAAHTRSDYLWITFDFTESESRTVLLALEGVNSGDPFLSLASAICLDSYGLYGRDIRACHAYLNYYDKFTNSNSYGTMGLFGSYSGWYTNIRIMTCESAANMTKCSSITSVGSITGFNNNLIDTSVFAQMFDSSIFDSDLGVFKVMPVTDVTSSYNPVTIFQYDGCTNKEGKVPFIVDFSASENTSQVSCGYGSSTKATQVTLPPRTVYIKLPSTRSVDMRICNTRSNSTSLSTSINLSLASWQYLATNAPSVSSKTLKVGKEAYTLFTKGSSAYTAILTTLTEKGWTVSES